jgi:plastocyanin domain-containing protein
MAIMKRAIFWGTVVGLGFLLGAISGTIAAEPPGQMDSMPHRSGQFSPIEQPLSHKILVTIGGMGLIGLELWWFLLNKPKSTQATVQGAVQAITVTVDGGYEPRHIVVQAGRTVRLNFDRQDPSSCLEEVRLPDFHIAQKLALHQITPIEFTPDKPGRYEFSCGMNMFRGVVEVQV